MDILLYRIIKKYKEIYLDNENIHKCNFCGKVLDVWDEQNDFSALKEEIQYGSKYDLSKLKVRLCNDCFDLLMDTFRDKCCIDPIQNIDQRGEKQ